MISLKNKLRRRLRGLFGFALAILLALSVFGVAAFAETAGMPSLPDMSDIMPDGTNVPDSDIGGATGMQSDTDTKAPGTSAATRPDTESSRLPASSASGMASADDDGSMGAVLGIIIAVVVVLAVIMLIIALAPKRDKFSNSSGKNSGNDMRKK